MRIVRETPGEILLRYDPRGASALFLATSGGLYAVLRFVPDAPRWFIGGVMGLFILLSGLGALWREEVELGLARGRWRRRAGWVGRAEESTGDLAEIPEVVLELARPTSSDDRTPTWNVEIKAARWPRPVVVASARREEGGYAELERWAKMLSKDAVDRTGAEPRRTSPDGVNLPLAKRGGVEEGDGSGFAIRVPERPPAGSRLLVASTRGRKRVELPALGWDGGTLAVVAFGAVFASFGGFAALVGAQVITGVRVNGAIPDGPVWPLAGIGALFALIGVLIAVAVLVGGRAHEWVEDAPDRLITGVSWLGMSWGRRVLLKREIEGVDLAMSPTATWSRVKAKQEGRNGPPPGMPGDVRIRTDARVVRIGRGLPESDRRWLRDTLDAMVRGG